MEYPIVITNMRIQKVLKDIGPVVGYANTYFSHNKHMPIYDFLFGSDYEINI